VRAFVLSITTLALALGAAAHAAAPMEGDDILARTALLNFAKCAVERTPQGAERLLAIGVDGAEYGKELGRYAKGHSYCAPRSRLQFAGLPFAGDLAEALIQKRYAGKSIATAAASPEYAGRGIYENIGQCVARVHPEAVTELFGTEPGSKAEIAALQKTGETLPKCVPTGATLKLNKLAVRAIYALGAYRLLAGPVPAAADGKG
jgi:hypothetical protein